MKWVKLLFFILGVAVYLTEAASAQQIITLDQAKQAVREFEDNPSLQFESGCLEQQVEGPTWSHRTWYYLYSLADGDTDYASWHVNACSGEVTFAYRDYAMLSQDYEEPPGPHTEAACHQIAELFARVAYALFDEMGMVLRDTEWTSRTWRFVWRQRYVSGAWTLNEVTVDVNPISGLVSFYDSHRVQEIPDRVPQLSSEQAIDLAKNFCNISSPTGTPKTELISFPEGLYWRVDNVAGITSDGYQVHYFVSLDADTGALVEKEAAFGIPHLKTVWVRELLLDIKNASVEWLGNGKARFFLEGRSYTLISGTKHVSSEGKTVMLDGLVYLQNGRLMVPANLIAALRSR